MRKEDDSLMDSIAKVSMLAVSDPHRDAAFYRKALIEVCNLATRAVPPPEHREAPADCRCEQIRKRAMALRLEDVTRMQHDSQLMKELRAFEMVAALQIEVAKLRASSPAAHATQEKRHDETRTANPLQADLPEAEVTPAAHAERPMTGRVVEALAQWDRYYADPTQAAYRGMELAEAVRAALSERKDI